LISTKFAYFWTDTNKLSGAGLMFFFVLILVFIDFSKIALKKAGIQIHKISGFKTTKPRWLKKSSMPSGETSIGFHGKKYR